MNTQPLIDLQRVYKNHHQAHDTIEVLKDVTLSLSSGESCSLTGVSGSGKTTLLNLCALLDNPSKGKICIKGEDCTTKSDQEKTDIRCHTMGFIYQFHHLLQDLTSLENTMLPLLMLDYPLKDARERAIESLENLGLTERMHHRPSGLSGGEQQRVSIARALCKNPAIIFGDEPTGSLDQHTAQKTFESILRGIEKTGSSFLIVTHNLSLASQTQRQLTIEQGKIQVIQ